MNNSLKNKIVSQFNSVLDKKWADFSSVPWLINYIEANVTNQHNIWTNIEQNLRKVTQSAGKNVRVAEANLLEVKFKMQNLSNDAMSESQCEKIIQLVNEAIVNCPFEQNKLLAKLFVLRATVLSQSKKLLEALKNVQMAIDTHRTKEYIIYKLKYLQRLDRISEALKLAQQVGTEPFEEGCELDANIDQLFNSLKEELKEKIDSSQTHTDHFGCEQHINQDIEEKKTNFDIDYRCKLNQEASKGRFFVATEDISEGTLVFREKAYSVILLQDGLLRKCSFCLKDVSNVFWPCRYCNEVCFCDATCAEKAWLSGHKGDCKLNHFWLSRSKSTFHMYKLLGRMGNRNIMRLEQDSNLYDIHAYIMDQEQMNCSEEDKSDQGRINAYKTQSTLVHHSEKFSPEFTVYHLLNAIDCAVLSYIRQGYDFSQFEQIDLVDLVKVCLKGIRRILINSFRWSEHDHNGNKQHIATCLCIVGSLFNHKCDYNADWVFENGNIFLSTNREIKCGEEISICYGYNKSMSFEERQKQNLSYFFQCNCSACILDSCSSLALQCRFCPGPVLCNSVVYNADEQTSKEATCLLCSQPYADSSVAVKKLIKTRQEIDFITKLFYSGIDRTKYVSIIQQHLNTVTELIYSKSNLLKDDVSKCCRVLCKEGLVDQCLPYGAIVDQIVPLYHSFHDIINGGQGEQQDNIFHCVDGSIDQEIDNMIFWVDVYKRFIEQTNAQDHQIWNSMLRFYYRLFKLLKFIIDKKKRSSRDVSYNEEEFVFVGHKEEIRLLGQLYHSKKSELEAVKKSHGQSLVFK